MPPWDAVWDLLRTAIVPSFAAAAIVAAAVERIGGPKQARSGAALGLIAGVALGFYWRNILPFVPGDSAWNRLPWAALIALCVGCVAHRTDDGWFPRGAASFGIAFWVIPDDVRADVPWLVVAYAALMWMNWMLLDILADESNNSSLGASMVLALLVAGGVLVFAGIARYMETAIVLAMALAGVALIAWWRQFDLGATVPAVAVLLPGLLLVGKQQTFVESIHWTAFALPALAPLCLAATLPIRDWPKARLSALRIALVLVPLMIAMALARQAGALDLGEPDW